MDARRKLFSIFILLPVLGAAARGGELLPYNPGQSPRAVNGVIDPAVYADFEREARTLNAASRTSLRDQFEKQRVAALSGQDSNRANYYARLIVILNSISGP